MDKVKHNLLLIEDNPGDAHLVQVALAEAPGLSYGIIHAGLLADGLQILAEQPVDLLLLDLGLPDSQGPAAVNTVRVRYPDLPIVVLSGHDDETSAMAALAYGAHDYLLKGAINGSMLARVIRYSIERQRLISEISASEARVHRIIEENADGVVVIDGEGIIRFANPAAHLLFGGNGDELLGSPLGRSIVDGVSTEIDITRKNQRAVTAELHSVSSSWEGEPAQIITLHDITDRKVMEADLARAREAAEAANRAKSDFMVTMSQEVRTPMNAIIGLSDLALKTGQSPSVREYLTQIQSTSLTLLELINNTLDYSWIEAGRLVLERIGFSLHELFDRVTAQIGVRARGKGLDFLVDIDQRAPERLVGDPHRLERVLLQLLGNAVKFTHEGEIVLTASVLVDDESTEKTMLSFSVKDTGIGMSTKQLAALFQPLPGTSGSTPRHYGGSGLGLSVCKNLVELMGGSIGAEGEPGRGSTFIFTVTFGLDKPDNRPLVQKKTGTVVTLSTESFRGAHILLVEDNLFNQQITREQLRGLGITTEVAQNGQEAVEVIAQRGDLFDGILMDVQMPVTDGYEATRLIRQTWSADRLPIIALTAHAREEDRERCLQAGMNDYLAKPVNREELFWRLARWVRPSSFAAGSPIPVESHDTRRSDLPDTLPGFNVSEGLARLNGNARLYRKLIIAFSRDKQNRVDEIRAALAAPDLHRAHLLAHGLRGVAVNLGATRLQAAAGAVCDACVLGDVGTVRDLLPVLAARMVEVTTAAALLKESTPSQEPEQIVGAFALDEILFQLHDLERLVARYDLEALDYGDRLRELLAGTDYAPLGVPLAEALDKVDFAGASVFLETLKACLLTREVNHE